MHQVDKIIFTASEVKGFWARGRVAALTTRVNEAIDRGEIHLHFVSGADNFCDLETKVVVFVDADEKPASEKTGLGGQ